MYVWRTSKFFELIFLDWICLTAFLTIELGWDFESWNREKSKNIRERKKQSLVRIQTLKNHIKVHSGEKPFEYQCQTFVDMHGLRSHTLVHTQEKKYFCEICEKAFSSSSSLKNDKLVHSGKKSHICSVCPRKFTNKSQNYLSLALVAKENSWH